MSINGLTFADYGRVTDLGLEEHFDGEIWFEAFWEARANFIRMFGEKEGRRRMQINVIEGLKLQPPRASMIDARDAIILANRVTSKPKASSSSGKASPNADSGCSRNRRPAIRVTSYLPSKLRRIRASCDSTARVMCPVRQCAWSCTTPIIRVRQHWSN